MIGVTFWRDANGSGDLDGSDKQLGSDTDGSDGWSLTVSTAAFPLGEATYFDRASDSGGRVSNVVSTAGLLQVTVDLYGTWIDV